MKHEYRDNAGRFEPGNPGGPGRRKREIEAQTLAAVLEVATPERIKLVIAAMLTRAIKNGDVSAARLILEYVAGKPKETIEIEGEGRREIVLKWGGMKDESYSDSPALTEAKLSIENPSNESDDLPPHDRDNA